MSLLEPELLRLAQKFLADAMRFVPEVVTARGRESFATGMH